MPSEIYSLKEFPGGVVAPFCSIAGGSIVEDPQGFGTIYGHLMDKTFLPLVFNYSATNFSVKPVSIDRKVTVICPGDTPEAILGRAIIAAPTETGLPSDPSHPLNKILAEAAGKAPYTWSFASSPLPPDEIDYSYNSKNYALQVRSDADLGRAVQAAGDFTKIASINGRVVNQAGQDHVTSVMHQDYVKSPVITHTAKGPAGTGPAGSGTVVSSEHEHRRDVAS